MAYGRCNAKAKARLKPGLLQQFIALHISLSHANQYFLSTALWK